MFHCRSHSHCTTRLSRASTCRPMALLSLRPWLLTLPTFACHGSPTTTRSSHTGTTSVRITWGGLVARVTQVAPVVFSPRYRALRPIGYSTLSGARSISPTQRCSLTMRLGCMRDRAALMWSTARWPMATPARQRECRRTTPPLLNISATAQEAQPAAVKATRREYAQRQPLPRRQPHRRQLHSPLRLQPQQQPQPRRQPQQQLRQRQRERPVAHRAGQRVRTSRCPRCARLAFISLLTGSFMPWSDAAPTWWGAISPIPLNMIQPPTPGLPRQPLTLITR